MTDTLDPVLRDTPPTAGGADPVLAAIEHAADVVRPWFPLADMVAANPLLGWEGHRPEEAAARAEPSARATLPVDRYLEMFRRGEIEPRHLDAALQRHAASGPSRAPAGPHGGVVPMTVGEAIDLRSGGRVAEGIDALVARWCAVSLDEHQAAWNAPARNQGLWPSWQRLCRHDRGLRRIGGSRAWRRIAELPVDPVAAVGVLLEGLDLPSSAAREDYLRASLRRLPGWVAALAARGGTRDVAGYLALRMALEEAAVARSGRQAADLLDGAGAHRQPAVAEAPVPDPSEPGTIPGEVWQEALELGYRDRLLAAIGRPGASPGSRRPARVQFVACIDVRSEGLRRHLEQVGGHDTIGYAGFFGLPVRVAELDADPVASCPVIVEPTATVREVPRDDDRGAARRDAVAALGAARHDAKLDGAAAFSLVEACGWVLGPLAALGTLWPRAAARLRQRTAAALAPRPRTRMEVDDGPLTGWTVAERAAVARGALRGMGLVDRLGELVVVCGHRGSSTNNPFAATLDCGACGGHSGAPNARALAAVLNDPAVRVELAARGVEVPDATRFVAAEHETTTDTVTVLDREDVPDSHLDLLGRVEEDLAVATARLRAERSSALPATGPADVARRRADWAEPVPEWALAGNAAVVVGSRELTRHVDLGRRVFLHEYDAARDEDGSLLASILAGPLVVGHWISSQYYFSSVDPTRFGSGSKPYHNVVGGTGVLEGAGGDLRLGLPLESVSFDGAAAHRPQHLLAVVDAPTGLLDELAGRDPAAAALVLNGWVRLVARREDPDGTLGWAELRRDGTWEPVGNDVHRTTSDS